MYETQIIDLSQAFDRGIREGAELIRQGELIAFPTETVYGLGANALRVEAVSAIFAAKKRPGDNPLIVHIVDREQAFALAHVTAEADALMDVFWPGPLTIVLPKRDVVPYEVTGGLKSVALRMPDDPAALALILAAGVPIAAPSANASGSPSPTTAQHVYADLQGRIPLILDGGPCAYGVESTVLLLSDRPTILRPGVITPEMIAEVIGPVEIDARALSPALEGESPQSPGVKYRHYAPRASVAIADGEGEALQRTAAAFYDRSIAAGRRCAIFATEQSCSFYGSRNYVIMGNRDNPLSLCRNLFALLRDADDDGFDDIVLEALPPASVGLAYMNRALRAAAFHVVRAEDLGL